MSRNFSSPLAYCRGRREIPQLRARRSSLCGCSNTSKGRATMLFVIEVLLTIAAWRKGWGAKALIPLGIGLAVAMLLGAMVGASGGPRAVTQVFPLFVLMDLAVIGVLVRLALRAPEEAPLSVVPQTLPSEEPVARIETANEIN